MRRLIERVLICFSRDILNISARTRCACGIFPYSFFFWNEKWKESLIALVVSEIKRNKMFSKKRWREWCSIWGEKIAFKVLNKILIFIEQNFVLKAPKVKSPKIKLLLRRKSMAWESFRQTKETEEVQFSHFASTNKFCFVKNKFQFSFWLCLRGFLYFIGVFLLFFSLNNSIDTMLNEQ